MLHHSPTRSRPRAMGHCMLPKLFRRMGDTWHIHYHDASDSPVGRAVAPRDGRRPPRHDGRARVRYRMFGERTGLRVSELALGAGTFGTRWGYGAEATGDVGRGPRTAIVTRGETRVRAGRCRSCSW